MTKAGLIEMPHPYAEIARIAFSMFVYVADVEKSVTAPEVQRFQTLLKETAWIENEDLRNAIFELQRNYSSFWASYEDGKLVVNAESIAKGLDYACRSLGEDRSNRLRRELGRFLVQFDRGAFGGKLIQGNQRARSRARKVLLAVLKTDGKQRAKSGRKHNLKRAKKGITAAEPAAAVWPAAAISVANAQTWRGGRTKVRCVSIVLETHDTKTYNFVAEPQTLFHFKPGQFVTIEALIQNRLLKRTYTISSSPSRPYTLSMTVKKIPMGWMSNWLFDNMTEGFECIISGPAGNFTCLDYPAEKLLFLAAGSGITPSMSMLRWLVDSSSKANVVFINNVRTKRDILFHQELLHLSAQLGERMRLAIVPAAISVGQSWHGPVGRFDEILLRSYAPDFAERETFVCGPPGYMEAVRSLLESIGFPMKHYHDESFGTSPANAPVALVSPSPVAPPTPTPTLAMAPASGAKIVIQDSGDSFVVQPTQSILEAAEASGVMLEHSCRNGTCGACKMHKVSGYVKMQDQSALSQMDIDSGYILTCVGNAVGEVMLSQ